MKKFDPKKPVQTRRGQKARIICADVKDEYYSVLALITSCSGDSEFSVSYTAEGKQYSSASTEKESPSDLVNIPEVEVYYVNLYTKAGPYGHHNDLAEANQGSSNSEGNRSPDWLGVIKILHADGRLVNVTVIDKKVDEDDL